MQEILGGVEQQVRRAGEGSDQQRTAPRVRRRVRVRDRPRQCLPRRLGCQRHRRHARHRAQGGGKADPQQPGTTGLTGTGRAGSGTTGT